MDQPHGSDGRLSVVGLAALFMIAGAISALLLVHYWDDRQQPEIVIVDPRDTAIIVVSVEGAVATPGVYDLSGRARVRDAIEAAGGPAADADLRNVNLARRLRDEERVNVPSINAQPPASIVREVPGSPVPAASVLNLNTASAAELETLPGIGPALADRIVVYRAENGSFQSVDDLEDVQGISARMVDELRPLVTVGP